MLHHHKSQNPNQAKSTTLPMVITPPQITKFRNLKISNSPQIPLLQNQQSPLMVSGYFYNHTRWLKYKVKAGHKRYMHNGLAN
jgi:hypothetical protein